MVHQPPTACDSSIQSHLRVKVEWFAEIFSSQRSDVRFSQVTRDPHVQSTQRCFVLAVHGMHWRQDNSVVASEADSASTDASLPCAGQRSAEIETAIQRWRLRFDAPIPAHRCDQQSSQRRSVQSQTERVTSAERIQVEIAIDAGHRRTRCIDIL